jgi:Sporulation and spore germination
MSRRAAGLILGTALLLVLASLAWWWRTGRAGARQGRRGGTEEAGGEAATERQPFDLYFPAGGGGLRVERRLLLVSEAPRDRARKVLEALLAGPEGAAPAAAPTGATSPGSPGARASPDPAGPRASPGSPRDRASPAAPSSSSAAGRSPSGLVRPFPPEVKLGSVQLSEDGTAFIDLRWPDHDDPPESGSTEEIQRVYSLVNSLTLNVPQVTRVVLLWNGTQRITFSGHLDTSRPLLPDRSLVAP